MSLVVFAKYHVFQPHVKMKYDMYVCLSFKALPWSPLICGRTTLLARRGKMLSLCNKLLKKINGLYSMLFYAAQLHRPRRKQPVHAEFLLATGWYFNSARLRFQYHQNSPRLQVDLSCRNRARFHLSLKYQNCWQLNRIVWISSLTECTAGLSSSLVLAGNGKSICRVSVNIP